MFGWFNAREAKEFGVSLAEFLMEKIPPQSDYRNKKELNDRRAALNKTAIKVRDFRKSHPLNMYQKAQFGNAFKWRLREANYDALFIDEVTDLVINQF